VERRGVDSTSSGYGPHGDEASVSIRGGEFLHLLSDYQILKKCAPWRYLVGK